MIGLALKEAFAAYLADNILPTLPAGSEVFHGHTAIDFNFKQGGVSLVYRRMSATHNDLNDTNPIYDSLFQVIVSAESMKVCETAADAIVALLDNGQLTSTKITIHECVLDDDAGDSFDEVAGAHERHLIFRITASPA